jgi:hypothetical protein
MFADLEKEYGLNFYDDELREAYKEVVDSL